jgi:hypothetical protein
MHLRPTKKPNKEKEHFELLMLQQSKIDLISKDKELTVFRLEKIIFTDNIKLYAFQNLRNFWSYSFRKKHENRMAQF